MRHSGAVNPTVCWLPVLMLHQVLIPPATVTGLLLVIIVPSPNAPAVLNPQVQAVPSVLMAAV